MPRNKRASPGLGELDMKMRVYRLTSEEDGPCNSKSSKLCSSSSIRITKVVYFRFIFK
jgi:hypothetical protein